VCSSDLAELGGAELGLAAELGEVELGLAAELGGAELGRAAEQASREGGHLTKAALRNIESLKSRQRHRKMDGRRFVVRLEALKDGINPRAARSTKQRAFVGVAIAKLFGGGEALQDGLRQRAAASGSASCTGRRGGPCALHVGAMTGAVKWGGVSLVTVRYGNCRHLRAVQRMPKGAILLDE